MRILVFTKRVPDTATRVQLAGAEGSTAPTAIRTGGVQWVVSPYDEMALEEAVRIKEKSGGEVVAVSLGGDETQAILRTALAMGADSAIHLRAEVPPGGWLDGHQVSSALAAALGAETFDLLLFGRLAADDQGSQVGTMTARKLGIPSVADVTRVELREGRARFHHLVDGVVEVVECALPAAATAQKGLAEPRYPSVKQILAAKKKTIESRDAEVPEAALETVALELPPPRKAGRIVGEGVAAVPELVRLLRDEAKVL